MAHPDRPLLADAKEEIARLTGDLGEMAGLRWQLALLELRRALRSAKRLAVVVALALIMGLTALPVLVGYAAGFLGERSDISEAAWLLIFGLGLLTLAILVGWLGWRRFRRDFTGMEQTLDELREDVVWLREWAGRSEQETSRH